MKYFFTILLAINSSSVFASDNWSFINSQKIDPLVKTRLNHHANTDALIYLDKVPDLSAAQLKTNRTERVRYVYETLKNTALTEQKPILKILRKNKLKYESFYIENVILIKNASIETLKTLVQVPNIERIALNVRSSLHIPRLNKNLREKIGDQDLLGHILRINAHRVWNELGVKGKGIVIGGQDTGYYWLHNAIKRQYRGFNNGLINHDYNWHDSFGTYAEPYDDHSHGTHTMGTALGDDGGSNKIGVAPEAKWIGCRNMKSGVGTVASYMSCFEFFLAPYPVGGDPKKDGRPELAPHIISNSWGCPPAEGCRGDELLQSIKALSAAGIINVVSAGNEGPGCSTVAQPPAHYSADVVSVGAYNRYMNDIASFSSRGPSKWDGGQSPAVVAYGDIIRSSIPGAPDRYDDKAGTSMASPQVAGVIALLWSARPELIGQIEKTREILQKSAQPLTSRETCGGIPGTKIPNSTFGYGMVDAYKALTTF